MLGGAGGSWQKQGARPLAYVPRSAMGPSLAILCIITCNVNNTEGRGATAPERAWSRGVVSATLMLVHRVRTSAVRGSLGGLEAFVGETPQLWKVASALEGPGLCGGVIFGLPTGWMVRWWDPRIEESRAKGFITTPFLCGASAREPLRYFCCFGPPRALYALDSLSPSPNGSHRRERGDGSHDPQDPIKTCAPVLKATICPISR